MTGSRTVLVFEYVTGGGLAGCELPASWLAEGNAMRRAIVEDFAALSGVQILAPIDSRVPWVPPAGVVVVPQEPGGELALSRLIGEADYTVLIAPETNGVLAMLSRSVQNAGGVSLGSSPEAVELTADKLRLADHLQLVEIPTPPTIEFDNSTRLPDRWEGPIVVKPIDGAGSIDTFLLRDDRWSSSHLEPGRMMIAQPFVDGVSMSASYLIDRSGQPWLLGIGRQRIEVDDRGRFRYRGGVIDGSRLMDLTIIERALNSVPGLRGFVGVDFVRDCRGELVILEINPRPTTSYVGLARLFPPGTIAGAWLASAGRGLAGTDWPRQLQLAPRIAPVHFAADGSICL